MVPTSGVGLAARRPGGRVRVAPIAHVLQGGAVATEARARRLLAVARVPLAADVRCGRELLLALLALHGLARLPLGGLGGLLRGLGLDVRPGSDKIVPIGLELSRGQEAVAVPPVVGVLAQDEVTKLDQCPGRVGIILQLVPAEVPV